MSRTKSLIEVNRINMPPYDELFPVGTRVKVKSRTELLHFREAWKWHHPVTDAMLSYAGQTASVKSVGFYHGGDVLYELLGVTSIWHEVCLEFAE